MKKFYYLLIFTGLLAGSELPVRGFDNQTPWCYSRGEFNISFTAYNNGGINLGAGVGVNDRISLGIIEFVDGLIGDGKNKWYIPGVEGKVSILNLPPEKINTSISYNPLYYGSFSEYTNKSYGITASVGKGFYIASSRPHALAMGLNLPILPDYARHIRELSLYGSMIVSFGQYFKIGTEMGNIHFKKNPVHRFIWNNFAHFYITDGFALQFILQVSDKKNPEGADKLFKTITSRNIGLSYTGYF